MDNKRSKREMITKIVVASLGLVPVIAAGTGLIIGYKLEYMDMGREPSKFKDFINLMFKSKQN